jgi:hypothetical protein
VVTDQSAVQSQLSSGVALQQNPDIAVIGRSLLCKAA